MSADYVGRLVTEEEAARGLGFDTVQQFRGWKVKHELMQAGATDAQATVLATMAANAGLSIGTIMELIALIQREYPTILKIYADVRDVILRDGPTAIAIFNELLAVFQGPAKTT
jgi:hypothetical protein